MRDFGKVISAESFKLRRQKSTLVVLILVALLALIMFGALEFAARRDWIGVPSGHFVAASVIGCELSADSFCLACSQSSNVSASISTRTE